MSVVARARRGVVLGEAQSHLRVLVRVAAAGDQAGVLGAIGELDRTVRADQQPRVVVIGEAGCWAWRHDGMASCDDIVMRYLHIRAKSGRWGPA